MQEATREGHGGLSVGGFRRVGSGRSLAVGGVRSGAGSFEEVVVASWWKVGSALLAVAAALLVPDVLAAQNCSEFCPTDGGMDAGPPPPRCEEVEPDPSVCADPPDEGLPPPSSDCRDSNYGFGICDPPACPEGERVSLRFSGAGDELWVLDDGSGETCATLRVERSGYYDLFDEAIAESCTAQRDEIAFLTITNDCNPGGLPLAGNEAGGRYVVDDVDNTSNCSGDDDCGGGLVCRPGTRWQCCVPAEPTYLGTFYLKAGMDNRICLHHWCPEWRGGARGGFVEEGCRTAPNSVHVRISGLFACPDAQVEADDMCRVVPRPDPCDGLGCPLSCRDGMCVERDGCEAMTCASGCRYGRCLEPWEADVDRDGDGYGRDRDCDDGSAYRSPAATEVCNGIDDDCDGVVDEDDVCGGGGGSGGGSAGDGGGSGGGDGTVPGRGGAGAGPDLEGGCACTFSASRSPAERGTSVLGLLGLLALLGGRRRRRP